MVRCCCVNFQCRGVLRIWIIVGQGPTDVLFSLIYHFCPLSPALWETAQYRLQYCLQGPLNTRQPTNQPTTLRITYSSKFGPFPKQTTNFQFLLHDERALFDRQKLFTQKQKQVARICLHFHCSGLKICIMYSFLKSSPLYN